MVKDKDKDTKPNFLTNKFYIPTRTCKILNLLYFYKFLFMIISWLERENKWLLANFSTNKFLYSKLINQRTTTINKKNSNYTSIENRRK